MIRSRTPRPVFAAPSRRMFLGTTTLGLAGLMSGCADINSNFPPTGPTGPGSAGPVSGNVIGNGPVRIALILPLTAQNGAVPAQALRNAAEMAIAEFNTQELTILVKDDKGTPEGAQAAAQEAIQEGAEAILGPLFAPTVSAVATVARAVNRPMIAFSTDASVAARGVYLLSFMPQSDVRRVMSFAAQRGKKSFSALIPQSSYGNVTEAEFTQYVAQSGARLVSVERYEPSKASLDAAITRLKGSIGQADSLFMPDDGNSLPGVAAALQAAGITSRSVQFLGTGVWNEQRVFKIAGLNGGWFAAPEGAGFQNFAQRYRARFNADPTRIATLSYDATALLGALAKQQGSQRFSEQVLTNASGFSGQDGIFRFRADGANERGLAVYQIGAGNVSVVQPAPRAFGQAGT